MDFSPTPGQVDAAALARQILTARCTTDRLTEVERAGDRFDTALWTELGEAGLVGLAVPEAYGGAGLSLLELASVLTEAGRVVAPVPLAAHAAAAMTLARFGTPAQQQEWLPAAASAASVLTAALAEDRADTPAQPTTRATREADGWRLTGTKTTVPAGTVADLFLVPASTDAGVALFLVRPGDPGVSVATQRLSDLDAVGRLELEGALLSDDRLVPGEAEAVAHLTQHATVAVAALQLGVCEGGLELTASYAKTREQFGRPIGTFQAVSQRLADAYIAVLGLRLMVTNAAWLLSEGRDAEVEVASAKLWAADTGHTVAHTTVHVHGGVGIDLDGAAHRYFTAAKRWELALGGSTLQARAVGRILADTPV